MKIVVVGTGYVGLVSGTCFSEMGNNVTCVDIDLDKINRLKKGIVPIYEPGLDSMVKKNVENGNLNFSNSLSDVINQAEIIFIAVGTPIGENGSADLKHVLEVAKSIGENINKHLIVVNKSTVPIGTADKVKEVIQRELDKRKVSFPFDVVSNPEFLKEGAAINDFMKPDRVIIGTDSDFAIEKLKQLYAPFCMSHERFITMDVRSAEMTKYAANTMLATKISFMNEIANICEKVGADANQVRIGIGSDSRIGYSFIYPGCGYGDYDATLINSVEEVNNVQKLIIAQKVVAKFGEDLTGKIFAVWGLAFKPGTDDMREAPALFIIKELVKRGAKIQAYDPRALKEARDFYLKGVKEISYVNSKYKALENADAMLLLTEWKEFRSPDFEEIKSLLKTPVIFDGRNQYTTLHLKEKGFEYYQIGK
jgi:UDPglucose 6-dehydrogenase